jgi:hypothetical protein
LPADAVRDGFTTFGGMTIAALNRFLNYTDELADAVGKHGAQGARNVLKRAIREARLALTDDMERQDE